MSTSLLGGVEPGALLDGTGHVESTLRQLLLRDTGKGANCALKESSKGTYTPGELQLPLAEPSPGESLAIQRHRK